MEFIEPIEDFDLLFYIGLLFLVSQVAGRIANYLSAPRVTGYLIVGILIGPYVLNIIDEDLIQNKLGLVTDIALSIIAFSIGGSLSVKKLKNSGKDIKFITIYQSVFTFIIVTLCMSLFMWLSSLKTHHGQAFLQYFPIAMLFGAISVATAPAAILAIIEEFKAKGSLTTILLGTVAIDDALTILIFSFAENLYILSAGGDALNLNSLLIIPFRHIFSAILIGAIVGFIVKYLSRFIISRATILGITLGSILITGGLALSFHTSVILSVMTYGFITTNLVKHHKDFFKAIRHIEEPIFGMFFLLAGAHLHINILLSAGFAALAITISRFAGKYLGAYLGAIRSNATTEVKKYIGLALLPQAGVAIALVFEADQFIHDSQISDFLITTILASIVINELVTPFLVKYSLKKAGDITISA